MPSVFKIKSYDEDEYYTDKTASKYQVCANEAYIYLGNNEFLYKVDNYFDDLLNSEDATFFENEILEMPNDKNNRLYNKITKLNNI